MVISFKDKATEAIFYGRASKAARKVCPQTLWRVARRKLDQLDSVETPDELKIPPGNQFKTLSGNRKGEYSIRINEQCRICFTWGKNGPQAVEITDYH